MKRKKILWLSLMVPYDKVTHASGKTENFYLKRLHQMDKFEIKLLTLCKEEEQEHIDLDAYGIDNSIYVRKRKGFLGTLNKGISWLSKFNINNKYSGLVPYDIAKGMKTLLRKLEKENYEPNIIIFDWTEILFFMPYVKKLYPKAQYIALEEDVSFLGIERRVQYTKNLFAKNLYQKKYKKVKELELRYLAECKLAVVNNRKDEQLLRDNGFKGNIWIQTFYFQSYLNKPFHLPQTKNVVFYGAMGREENWKSALWFIDNVLEKIQDKDVKFVIIGSSPNQRLLKLNNPRVEVKGFVEDISIELQNALCMVVPLVLGAGMKVKVIEALSCGIPILSNTIGIEGVPAKNKRDYFFCEHPDEYVEIIDRLLKNEVDLKSLYNSARQVIIDHFDYERDVEIFAKKLEKLCD